MNLPNNPLGAVAKAVPAGGIVAARSRPTGAPGSGTITASDIWRIIRRRAWVITITSIILMILGVGINIAWLKWWPSWPGVAILQVESPGIQEAAGRQRQQPAANLFEMFARAEAQRIKSRYYASLVLGDSKVKDTKWYKKYKNNFNATMIAFEEELSVGHTRQTPQIRVVFHTKDPEEAPRIVNTLTRIYLDDRQELAKRDLVRRLASLDKQEDDLEEDLRSRNKAIDLFVTAEKIPLAARQTEVETLLNQYAEAQGNLEMVQRSIATAMQAIEGRTAVTWTPDPNSQARIDSDPIVQNLRQYLLNLKEERQAQSKRLGHDHLFMKRFDDRIEIGRRDRDEEMARLKQQFFYETVSGLEQAKLGNEETLEEIAVKIQDIRDKQDILNTKILTYQNMEANKERLRESLKEVRGMINKTTVTLEETKLKGMQVQLVSPAMTAPERSSPNLVINLIATFFLSLMMGVGLAFLLEFMDKSVRSSQDIRRHTNLSLLGSIPNLEEDEANPADMYSVVTHAPHSLLAEAFRQIRTNIMFSCRMRKCRSMLITSAAPDDGRTCIAVNLAASIALSGKKVLLIDANFRKPALKRLFANLPDVGFAQLLAGKASIEQTIAQSDTPGLWIMGNGQTSAHHSGLLGGSRLADVIEQLSTQFDQVILDGPPALLSADALTLSGQVAGIVFVVRAGKNSRGELNRMRDEISKLNGHIHGVVLNAVEAVGGGYLRKRYRQFYDYEGSFAEVAARTEVQSLEGESEAEPGEES